MTFKLCNGELAKAFQRAMPPDQVAHVAAHAIAREARLREALAGMSRTLTMMNRSYRPQDVWALLDQWNEKAIKALRAE